jgi:hypothetical protein
VKDDQLFVELTPSFCELIESCLALGIGGAAMRRYLQFVAA